MRYRLDSLAAPLLAAALVFGFALPCGGQTQEQTARPFAYRAGQTVYIVAYQRWLQTVTTDAATTTTAAGPEYSDYNLDAERKVRKRVEEWRFFRVVDKISEADFIFLVTLEDNSMEGLAVPPDAYRQHFKEKYDLDALREAAHGRYLAGPLKLATVTRLADRLVKNFREGVSGAGRASAR